MMPGIGMEDLELGIFRIEKRKHMGDVSHALIGQLLDAADREFGRKKHAHCPILKSAGDPAVSDTISVIALK
jgi:hypothetical protein